MEWGEIFVPTARLVLVSERRARDMRAAQWHAAAHIALGHHEQRGISDDDEQWANQLAALMDLGDAA